MNRSVTRRILAAAGLLLLCLAAPLRADPAAPDAARAQRLLEAAKKEGVLTLYTSTPSDDIKAVIDGFEKKYGVRIEVWRSGSENVLQRMVTEGKARHYSADVVATNGPELEAMHREGLLQKTDSPYLKTLMPAALQPHGEWVASCFHVFVQAYNTTLVKKEDLPRSWNDLLDPKWKGRLAVETGDFDWMSGLFAQLGEEQGSALLRQIVARNGISVRKGHTLLTQLVISGEVPFALTVYSYKAEQMKRRGAPLDWITIGGTAVALPNGLAVARNAPHPNAAALFFDYELSDEGQKILAGRDFVPTSTQIETPFSKIALQPIDPVRLLEQSDKWQNLFDDIMGIGH